MSNAGALSASPVQGGTNPSEPPAGECTLNALMYVAAAAASKV
jgi:hypothetical protein